jgi:hypothetical protein
MITFKQYFKRVLLEAESRIQHAEDLIFFEGSAGALRALNQFKQLAQNKEKITIKWDGSPAVIFGRNEQGEFVFTDKSGFVAKGYQGKTTSAEDLKNMLMQRPGAQKNPTEYGKFATRMGNSYRIFEAAVPKDFRGYFKGDILYFSTPEEQNGSYVFKPNVVKYSVKKDSALGQKISNSKVGVVIHRLVDEEGNESPLKDFSIFQGTDLLVIPPVTVTQAPKVDISVIQQTEAVITKNARKIDDFLNPEKLASMKLTDFPQILYKYINSKVDTGMTELGKDFLNWLPTSGVSGTKQEKIQSYIQANKDTFFAVWTAVDGIIKAKNNIIAQLDQQDSDVKASINETPGGEGYVLAAPEGDIKFVNRSGFTAANRAVKR